MSNFANAPAPTSALFDNAPAQPPTVEPVAVPSHLTPASRICQDRGGRWISLDVYMQYGRPISLELALRRVQNGRTVFVARGDAAAVLAGVASGTE